ncbi:MAG: DUF3006 domain-containing protein [Clostridia bacterium]|nr:DUF3006 domain-containing protein [Clostridia bacterium]
MIKLIVDRIEEGIAVLEKEDLTHISINLSDLPKGTKEGCVLSFDGTTYVLDLDEEERRRKRILEMQNLILKKAKKD